LKSRVVPIDKLCMDPEIYPRLKVGWLTAYSYSQAMKAGQEFPPVQVGLFKGKMIVVDGWHRIEARKLLKLKYVQAVLVKYTNLRDLFADAVRLNISHGRPLSMHEKVRIIDRLQSYDFSIEDISRLTAIPVDGLKVFTARTLTLPSGEKVYLKSPLAKSPGAHPENVNQQVLSGIGAESLMTQLIELFESGAVDIENVRVRELTVHLFEDLQSVLKLEQTTV